MAHVTGIGNALYNVQPAIKLTVIERPKDGWIASYSRVVFPKMRADCSTAFHAAFFENNGCACSVA